MRVVKIVLSCLLLCACSIKEDRSECPCITYIDIDEFIKAGFYEATLSFTSESLNLQDQIVLNQTKNNIIEQILPRTQVSNSLVTGIENCIMVNNAIIAPPNCEFDSIWLSAKDLDCKVDELYVKAIPLKQYCNMTLIVSEYEGEEYPYNLRLKAKCNGVDIYTHKAIDGNYCVYANRISNSVFFIRVPRQKENSLILEICSLYDDEVVQTLNLGAALRSLDYNWNEPNLSDLSVKVDYSDFGLEVQIGEWEDNNQYLETDI